MVISNEVHLRASYQLPRLPGHRFLISMRSLRNWMHPTGSSDELWGPGGEAEGRLGRGLHQALGHLEPPISLGPEAWVGAGRVFQSDSPLRPPSPSTFWGQRRRGAGPAAGGVDTGLPPGPVASNSSPIFLISTSLRGKPRPGRARGEMSSALQVTRFLTATGHSPWDTSLWPAGGLDKSTWWGGRIPGPRGRAVPDSAASGSPGETQDPGGRPDALHQCRVGRGPDCRPWLLHGGHLWAGLLPLTCPGRSAVCVRVVAVLL